MDIQFPVKKYGSKWQSTWQKHYHRNSMQDMHFNYILQLFKNSKCNIEYFDPEKSPIWSELSKVCGATKWEIRINETPVIIDHSDDLDVLPSKWFSNIPCFKFHYDFKEHKGIKNLYPLSPINFTNWNIYKETKSKINYNPQFDGLIMNNQRTNLLRPKQRRKMVQNIIKSKFPNVASLNYYGNTAEAQNKYWMNINNALVSVHVPGARNNMLDRGQGQMFGLGVCTISPKLQTILADYTELQPDIHYKACKDDYSDLVETILWCRENLEECKEIGNNAKQLFETLLLPDKLIEWIKRCLT